MYACITLYQAISCVSKAISRGFVEGTLLCKNQKGVKIAAAFRIMNVKYKKQKKAQITFLAGTFVINGVHSITKKLS